MDPFSITLGVTALLGTISTIIRACDNLRSKYELASEIIPQIAGECGRIELALSHAKEFLEMHHEQCRGKDDLLKVIENSLAGCSVVLKLLNLELSSYGLLPGNVLAMKSIRTASLRYALNETKLQGLLDQLKNQQGGLTLIFTILHARSMNQVLQQLRSNSKHLARISKDAQSLQVAAPDSDTGSIFSFTDILDSSSTRFDFDDQVVDAEAYRRVVHTHRNNPQTTSRTGQVGPAVAELPAAEPVTETYGDPATWFDQVTSTELEETANSDSELISLADEDIFSAIKNKRYRAMETLIDTGIDLSIRNESGHSPLNEAAHIGDAKACYLLLQGGAGPESRCYADSCTQARPLHLAAHVNSVASIRVLLRNRARLECVAYDGTNALHWAASADSVDAFLYLISEGLSPAKQDSRQSSALHVAVSARAEKIVRWLLSHRTMAGGAFDSKNASGRTPLQLVITNGWAAGLQLFVDAGFDLLSSDTEGLTPLHMAANQAWHDGARILIRANADLNARGPEYKTPLHCAALAQGDSCRMIWLLVDSGADLEAITVDGSTPLLLGVGKSNSEVVRSLLRAGANPNAQKSCGCKLFQVARQNEDYDVFEMLLSEFSDRKEQPPHGQDGISHSLKALACAVASTEEYHQLLVQSIPNAEGTAPSSPHCRTHSAFSIGHLEAAIQLCKQSGSSVHDVYETRTALRRAIHNNLPEAVERLIAEDFGEHATNIVSSYKNLRKASIPWRRYDARFHLLTKVENAQSGIILKEYRRKHRDSTERELKTSHEAARALFQKGIQEQLEAVHQRHKLELEDLRAKHASELDSVKESQATRSEALGLQQAKAWQELEAVLNNEQDPAMVPAASMSHKISAGPVLHKPSTERRASVATPSPYPGRRVVPRKNQSLASLIRDTITGESIQYSDRAHPSRARENKGA